MIRFIWQNWWRRKEKFILLIIGAFIVSAGLTYLIGLSETNKGTIVDTLQQRWSASYDIIVRPDGTRSVTEEKKLLEPNYLSGLGGGISVEQYEAIKEIPGVEIAAPIALIGYADYAVYFGDVEIEEPGIYRKVRETTVNNGIKEIKDESNSYFPHNANWNYINKTVGYGAGAPDLDLTVHTHSLLAGIDPEQEAKLVGLDEAILAVGSSRYFEESDEYYFNQFNGGHHEFPIVVNQHAFVDKVNTISFERLAIPITNENGNEVMERVKENGGKEYLDSIDGDVVHTFSVTGEEAFQTFVSRITGIDWETGEVLSMEEENTDGSSRKFNWNSSGDNITGILFKPSPLEYEEITSPYSDRWPYSYRIAPFQNDEDAEVGRYRNKDSYREPRLLEKEFINLPRIKPNWIGFYDASKLAISKDPTNELPMETYRPATAEYVMDAEGNPMNPPKLFKPTDDPYGFLTDPPGMLTTIEAAEKILGDKPISAIRIKVAGVADLSEESQTILEQVAAEIEARTGLITDITLGSSPQLALTYIPGLNGESDIGWLQQPWVNIGSSISIFNETKVGFAGIVASVIAVAIIYVWASGIVSLLARRKEFAVLLSIGWRPSQLSRLLLLESSILGAFVAVISWTMLGFVIISSDATISPTRFVWTGLFGLIIYVLGAIAPMISARAISPYEAMRTGEISGKSSRLFQARGIYRMALNHFIGKWRRSFLSVISIALPTALLAVFLYITFRLRGIMYTSLLGEYVAVEIGPAHYAAIIVSLLIAILTTAEIMWQNVSERSEEISLLQAIGWKRRHIRRLILAEGAFSGLFAAVIGLTIAFLMIWGLYASFPSEEIGFILATGLIPVVIGVIGTISPAERAVRIIPNQGMGGNISNRKAVERRLKWVVISTSVLLVGTFLFTMVKVAPKIELANKGIEVEQAFSPTEGSFEEKTDSNKPQIPENKVAVNRYETPGKYQLEFNANETSVSKGWGGSLFYEAKEIESSLPSSESGMKNIAIEFTFEILDVSSYEMRPRDHFSLLVGEETYRPVKFEVLETESWIEKRYLDGYRDGKMRAVLEFTVPDNSDRYGLLLRNGSVGKGFMVWFENTQLEEQNEARNYFEEMITAAEENNKTAFMSFQDETNQLFYKEQEVWLQTLNQIRKEGWTVSIVLNDVTLKSSDEGSITFQINSKHGDRDVSNRITYSINKNNGTWKMNDLPFEKITDGPIHLYYLPSLENKAKIALADTKELVDLYIQTFAWELEEINIKLYDSVEEISASTGWPTLFGVASPFVSNKFVVQGDYEIAYGFMKHELVHAMLAELTNDNAPHFLQEGLAIFISSSVVRDELGNLQLDFNNTTEREKVILELTPEIKPIADLEDSNYTDDSPDIYNVGFLITNYLIQTYGIEKYLEVVDALKEHDIIGYDNPEKEQIAYNLAIEALEQTYGSINKLSEEYIKYYNKRK